MERRCVHFSGQVQGVGFRYSTLIVARRYRISGYVKNLPDGRVVLEAEGEPDELDRFFSAIQHKMGEYIHQTDLETCPATGEFVGFDLRY